MNQWRRICGKDISYAVQGVVVEPTNACNLKCKHCTAQGASEDIGYMDMALYKKILKEHPLITSMILTRNGEPFLHPNICEMIEEARARGIYVIVYTNGTLLDDGMIEKIFNSGLNELNFSLEGTGRYYNENRGADYEKCAAVIKKVLQRRNQIGSRMKIGINTVITEDNDNGADVEREWGGVVDYITHEPLMGQRSLLRKSACRTLWRNAVVAWNGDVSVCCSDMHNRLKIGNAQDNTLSEIYNGPMARSLRQRHLKKDFPDICQYCHPHFG